MVRAGVYRYEGCVAVSALYSRLPRVAVSVLFRRRSGAISLVYCKVKPAIMFRCQGGMATGDPYKQM